MSSLRAGYRNQLNERWSFAEEWVLPRWYLCARDMMRNQPVHRKGKSQMSYITVGKENSGDIELYYEIGVTHQLTA